jgi:tRNA-specific 2-thiouridylase
VSDVEDARRVAQQLGLAHHVFNFTDDFDRHVVDPYVADHAAGRTPNPCVACNRHLKFDRLLRRADQLGFDAVATGHYARVVAEGGRYQLRRGLDPAKDQSYVLHMLTQDQLRRVLLPVGDMHKSEVRGRAQQLGLRTAAKPDSQDVCFITKSGGRESFLGDRIPLHPGRLVDRSTGQHLGNVAAVELVTVGQRRGFGDIDRSAGRRYAVDVDISSATVRIGTLDDLLIEHLNIEGLGWVDQPTAAGQTIDVQVSAHGRPQRAILEEGDVVRFVEPQRRVASGQSVVLYDGDRVLGGGVAV